MGFPSLLPSAAAHGLADAISRLPELSDAEYLREVLNQTNGTTEADVFQQLAEKASSLSIDLPPEVTPSSNTQQPSTTSGAPQSAATVTSQHARTASTGSNGTASTGLTLHHSTVIPATLTEPTKAVARPRSKTLGFSLYDKYLTQAGPALNQPKLPIPRPIPHPTGRQDRSTTRRMSNVRMTARRTLRKLTRRIAARLRLRRRRPESTSHTTVSCVCCREDFVEQDRDVVHTLPCGDIYCRDCLAVMISQSTVDEQEMPPRCCSQPVPSAIIKAVLHRDAQQKFLKAVVQYSTPFESRIFCPNASCGEFIPPRAKIDAKNPFVAVCKKCKTRACILCKRGAHWLDQDCPEDRELEAVLKMGEECRWRRCYKCRTLVELSEGCAHITCRCKAQFCYICGAVWDSKLGCPNFCNGEEELERRRVEEATRLAELEAEKQAAAAEELEKLEAERRTRESVAFKTLRVQQEAEMARFRAFERKARATTRTRYSEKKHALVQRYSDLLEKMEEHHSKAEQHLEDRQVEAEIELRSTLEQSDKNIAIKLKHMEAFCRGGPTASSSQADNESSAIVADSEMPPREVTPKHLEQLEQQYRIRDGMGQLHQSQINVLRERQAKRMKELLERQEKEMEALAEKKAEEIEGVAVEFTNEEEALAHVFAERKARLQRRWQLAIEILRVELGRLHDTRYGPMPLPEWPVDAEVKSGPHDHDEDPSLLPMVTEEAPPLV
ncbi:hypothetical protein QBC46DRAFT_351684 [Diplogelasinospora grovesii]|uniref:RBR-type E3 ubiquitin transferase n=1 Tax=Diplogelasinospora grovesii TaxID=303347 RepID=A0AAN6S796_9PEZI|nr:hypothetical protein QBC46DRAFT_351684 [Diplogelasinospora grovesii]